MQRLLAAIEAATLVRRQPDDDGERFVVGSDSLGGMFIYSREETERRIILKFPDLCFEDVSAASRYLEDRIRIQIHALTEDQRRSKSWVMGWAEER